MDWLYLAEMAYNNGYHTAIKQSPFHALYGYDVRDIGAVAAEGMEGSKEPGAWLEADRHSEAHRVARAAIEAARQRMISLSQTRRSDIPEYHVNEWVLIAAEEIPNPRLSKKLSDKWVGPFRIKEVPGDESQLQANNIRIDPSWSKMEPIINVDRCKPYIDPNSFEGRPRFERLEAVEGGQADKYEVERIMDERIRRGKKEYFVSWKGYGKEDEQWVAADQFEEDDQVVLDFEKEKDRRGQVLSHRKETGGKKQKQSRAGLRKR